MLATEKRVLLVTLLVAKQLMFFISQLLTLHWGDEHMCLGPLDSNWIVQFILLFVKELQNAKTRNKI